MKANANNGDSGLVWVNGRLTDDVVELDTIRGECVVYARDYIGRLRTNAARDAILTKKLRGIIQFRRREVSHGL